MKKTILFFILSITSGLTQAQIKTYYIIADTVNIWADTNFSKKYYDQVSWGEDFQGQLINQNWFMFPDAPNDNMCYIQTKHLAEGTDFYKLAENKALKNGRTKYELLQHWLEINNLNKVEEYAFDLIQNHTQEFFSMGFEHCNFLGPQTFLTLNSQLKQTSYLNILNKVIANSCDSTMLAYAHIEKSEIYLKENNLKKASKALFYILENYSNNLFIPLPCDSDISGKVILFYKTKQNFVQLLSMQQNTTPTISKLKNLKNHHLKNTRVIVKDILENPKGLFINYENIKYSY